MPQVINFLSPRALQLMKQIEIEHDQESLTQLFRELELHGNDRNDQRSKKSP